MYARLLTLLMLMLIPALILAMNAASVARAAIPTVGDKLIGVSVLSLSVGSQRYETRDEALLDAFSGWQLADVPVDAFGEPINPVVGRPLAQIHLETDGTRAGGIVVLVFADPDDADTIILYGYSAARLNDRLRHDHPDLLGQATARANLDALREALDDAGARVI